MLGSGYRAIPSVACRRRPKRIQKQIVKRNRPVFGNAGHTLQRHAQILRLPNCQGRINPEPKCARSRSRGATKRKQHVHGPAASADSAHPQLRSHRKVTCGCETSMIEEGNKKRRVGENTHGNDGIQNKPGALAQSPREPADMQVS